MNKNVIRVVIILAVVLSAVVLLRWSMIGFLAPKKTTGPGEILETSAVKGPEAPERKMPDSPADVEGLLKEGKRAEAISRLEEIVSSKSGSKQACQALLLLADIYKADGNLLKTREIYLAIIKEYPDFCDYSEIQRRLTALNMDILFSTILTETSQSYTVKPGDSLAKIAKDNFTTVALIKRANRLKSDIIRPGLKLKVEKIPFSIIVDKSQSILTLVLGEKVIKTYPVSTGKNNSTPTGTFKIKDKLIDPVWYSAGAVVPADSPENVLGSRWLGLTNSEPGYGIHGTTDPGSIGYQCTEGCVRMHNADVEELFDVVPPGTEVTIID